MRRDVQRPLEKKSKHTLENSSGTYQSLTLFVRILKTNKKKKVYLPEQEIRYTKNKIEKDKISLISWYFDRQHATLWCNYDLLKLWSEVTAAENIALVEQEFGWNQGKKQIFFLIAEIQERIYKNMFIKAVF